MSRSNSNVEPRASALQGRVERQPGLGAYHQIDLDSPASSADISFFASDFQRLTREYFSKKEQATHTDQEVGQAAEEKEVFEPIIDVQSSTMKTSEPVKFYTPEFMRMKVLERKLSQNHANQHRLYWNRNDMGQIKGEIGNELGRLELGRGPFDVKFTGVQRVGDANQRQLGRKLALIPDAESPEAEFLCQEHEICVEGLTSRLKKFKYPYDEFLAKLTFARVERRQPEKVAMDVIRIANQLLPVTVTFLPIEFYANQSFRP